MILLIRENAMWKPKSVPVPRHRRSWMSRARGRHLPRESDGFKYEGEQNERNQNTARGQRRFERGEENRAV